MTAAHSTAGRKGGKKGGLHKGPSKRRGDAAYYRELARKAWEKRRNGK